MPDSAVWFLKSDHTPEDECFCRISGHRRLRNELRHADEKIRSPHRQGAHERLRPEGPGAAPFRARWRFESTTSGRRWTWSGWKSNTSWESASYGSAGRPPVEITKLLQSLGGAGALNVSAYRAADSFPRCTGCRARWAARAARASGVATSARGTGG